MKRRSFLGATLGALAVAGQVDTGAYVEPGATSGPDRVPTDADTFVYGHGAPDWRVRWLGWRQPVNQLPMIGVWTACPIAANFDKVWTSTTSGAVAHQHEFAVLDFYHYKHGSKLFDWSTPEEKLTARRAALARLLTAIKTGEEFPGDREWVENTTPGRYYNPNLYMRAYDKEGREFVRRRPK